MSKKISNIVSVIILLVLMASTNILAATPTNDYLLPKNLGWVYSASYTRSTAYSYGDARLNAVFPQTGGTDNFRYCWTKPAVYANGNWVIVGNEVQLDETKGTYQHVYIKEGYLNNKSMIFMFRGNDARYSATANVTLSGK